MKEPCWERLLLLLFLLIISLFKLMNFFSVYDETLIVGEHKGGKRKCYNHTQHTHQ